MNLEIRGEKFKKIRGPRGKKFPEGFSKKFFIHSPEIDQTCSAYSQVKSNKLNSSTKTR